MISTQAPVFRNTGSGQTSHHALELLGESPQFSLDRLATMLANPFLEAEHPPVCPWVGIDRVDTPVTVPPAASRSVADLEQEFVAAVDRCIGDAAAVAVLYSGGLDSTNVLYHAYPICRDRGIKLIAITWDLTDQFGIATSNLVRPQLAALGLDEVELVVIPAVWDALPEPDWSADGPRLDYYSRLHTQTQRLAADRGCEILLTGIGGDEVLGAWNGLTADLLRRRRWSDLRGYLKGFVLGGTVLDLGLEALTPVQRLLPGAFAFDLYAAISYREEFQSLPTVLTPHYSQLPRRAAQEWLHRRWSIHRDQAHTWAQASVYDSIYPMAYAAHPGGSLMAEASPFLDTRFIRYALGVPFSDRFRRSGEATYHWYKALHRRLLPAVFDTVTPTYKQSYSHIFVEYQRDTAPAGELAAVDLGLIDPDRLADVPTIHARLPSVVRNVENWLRGALTIGAVPA